MDFSPWNTPTDLVRNAVNLFSTDMENSGGLLDGDGIPYLCESSCLSSLENSRSIIAGACTASIDVVVINDIEYPGSQTEVMEWGTFSDLLQPHSSLIVTFTRTIWLAGKTGVKILTNVILNSTKM